MLEIHNFRISEHFTTHTLITWEIKPTFEDVSNYLFELLRADSANGEYTLLASLSDQYIYLDEFPIGSRLATYYYKIQVRNIITGDTVMYGPIWFRQGLDDENIAIAREIIRRNDLVLKNYIGQPAFVFQKRTFGEKCTACYDPIKEVVLKSQCDICFRTGYKGGYFNPIPIWYSAQSDTEQVMLNEMGKHENADKLIWTGVFPIIHPGDIIVPAQGRDRYRVVSVQGRTALRGKNVRQMLALKALPYGDVEFKIPIPNITTFPTYILGNEYPYKRIDNYTYLSEYTTDRIFITQKYKFLVKENTIELYDTPIGIIEVFDEDNNQLTDGADYTLVGKTVTINRTCDELYNNIYTLKYFVEQRQEI